MNIILFRPDPKAGELEGCSVCNRAIGMVIDNRTIPAPLMCVVCSSRFPPDQWEIDEEGFYFNLTKNGVDDWSNGKITAIMDKTL